LARSGHLTASNGLKQVVIWRILLNLLEISDNFSNMPRP
jgi:hypothetical protein